MMKSQTILDKIGGSIWNTIKAVFTANRDYPYHDAVTISDGSEPVVYQVGTNNQNANGDQQKRFVSKSTLIYSDVECTIRFNDSGNTPITILAETYYTFKSNVTFVYVSAIASQGTLYMYFEGVLPQETRDAE